MTDTTGLNDPARHIDSDAEIVAKHAKAEVDTIGHDYFNIVGTISPNGFEAARQKGYVVSRVMTLGEEPCTRFVLDN